jgi:hypothetical protein
MMTKRTDDTEMTSSRWGPGLLLLLLLFCVCFFFFKETITQMSPIWYVLAGFIPFVLILLVGIFRYAKESFYFLFAMQFVIIIATDSIEDMPFGLITYILFLVMTLMLLNYHFLYKPFIDWKTMKTPLMLLLCIWCAFCFLELANPNTVLSAWNVSMPVYAIYPILCALLIPITVKNIKGVNVLLIIWSVFVLICVLIAMRQQYFGFTEKEKYFLYVLGGATTHIIWSGTRYFSCFTDAANFGVHMAMAATVFGLSAFFVKRKGFRLYMLFVALAALYGMGLSGTRSAIAIPLAALLLFVFLQKNLKMGLSIFTLLLFVVVFFTFTTIGNSNMYIYKMRSAFHPKNDPSYVVRVENRKKISELMYNKPFGYGLGLSKPGLFHPKERMPFPPDSFLVSVWVETGIIGLLVYTVVHLLLFIWAGWILLFRVKDRRVRGLLSAWLCMGAGFFVAAYTNDVMQLPNPIVIYMGFALCYTAPFIDANERNTIRQQTTS